MWVAEYLKWVKLSLLKEVPSQITVLSSDTTPSNVYARWMLCQLCSFVYHHTLRMLMFIL